MSGIKEHGHCENCGDPVPLGEHFCNDDCGNEYTADVKEAKKLDDRLYIIMAVVIGVAAVAAYAVGTLI
jgi:predicted nucleic acid-binding Zn ribbon protein